MQKLPDHEAEFTDLQREIDNYLDQELRRGSKKRKSDISETEETNKFIQTSTMDVINECLEENVDDPASEKNRQYSLGMAPDIAAMCTPVAVNEHKKVDVENDQVAQNETGELDLEGLDDDEIDGYIMTEDESKYKDEMWNRLNADYLKEAKAKEERSQREREEGKPEKKKRRVSRKKNIGPSNTAGEAIEKMLQEKKISSKINYEILKTLTAPTAESKSTEPETNKSISEEIIIEDTGTGKPSTSTATTSSMRKPKHKLYQPLPAKRSKMPIVGLPVVEEKKPEKIEVVEREEEIAEDEDFEDDHTEAEPEPDSLANMLNNGADDDYYGYDDAY